MCALETSLRSRVRRRVQEEGQGHILPHKVPPVPLCPRPPPSSCPGGWAMAVRPSLLTLPNVLLTPFIPAPDGETCVGCYKGFGVRHTQVGILPLPRFACWGLGKSCNPEALKGGRWCDAYLPPGIPVKANGENVYMWPGTYCLFG